jgi:hypothetical protein
MFEEQVRGRRSSGAFADSIRIGTSGQWKVEPLAIRGFRNG